MDRDGSRRSDRLQEIVQEQSLGATPTALVTGANSGVGFEVATGLAASGYRVLLACRNREFARQAIERLQGLVPGGTFLDIPLDLADLGAVRQIPSHLARVATRLDLAVFNAGVMLPPRDSVTRQGAELQMGVNHVGHHALLEEILEFLLRAKAPRVVWVSSLASRFGVAGAISLRRPPGTQRWRGYADSKLAQILHARETSRRHPGIACVVAHPGVAATRLNRNFHPVLAGLLGQNPSQGAAPVLRACQESPPEGCWFGPSRWGQTRGAPAAFPLPSRALHADPRLFWEATCDRIRELEGRSPF